MGGGFHHFAQRCLLSPRRQHANLGSATTSDGTARLFYSAGERVRQKYFEYWVILPSALTEF
jgi:hypothetical protein